MKDPFFFPFLMLSQWGGITKKLGRSIAGIGDLNWPRRHHRMSCPVCKLGGVAGRVADLGSGKGVWHWSACGHAALCITFFPPIIILILILIQHYYCILLCFHLLNCSCSTNAFYFISPPHSTRVVGEVEQVALWYLISSLSEIHDIQ